MSEDPVPPEAPLTITRLCDFPGGGSQSKQANAVRATKGTEAAASWDNEVGFFTTTSEFGLTVMN